MHFARNRDIPVIQSVRRDTPLPRRLDDIKQKIRKKMGALRNVTTRKHETGPSRRLSLPLGLCAIPINQSVAKAMPLRLVWALAQVWE